MSRRFWLPLPERTVNDRVKLHCPPGFVDRAYLVFLQRTANQYSPNYKRPAIGLALTPFSKRVLGIRCALANRNEPRWALGAPAFRWV